MKKQNIEDIFSALENYATTPPPELWNGIASQLDKPKRKKRAILWWPVAASLLIGLSLGGMFLFTEKNSVAKPTTIDGGTNLVIENQDQAKKQLQLHDSITIKQNTITKTLVNNKNKNKNNVSASGTTKIQGNQLKNLNSNVNSSWKQFATNEEVSNTDLVKNQNLNSYSNSYSKSLDSNNSYDGSNSNLTNTNSSYKSAHQLAVTDSTTQLKIEKELLQLENALAKIDDNPEKTAIDNTTIQQDKWSVAVYAGLANSENYSNKKVLGADVSSKQSNGYGIKTNYKLNKKWGVSAGLKINELGQSVANLSYYNKQNSVAMGLATNDFFRVNQNVAYITTNESYVFAADNDASSAKTTNTSTATIDQNLQYIEMPLEVSYSVFNSKKTNIRFNTGGFMGKLISNEVTLDGTSIGENLNVNNFIYGSKLSSTIQYEIFKKTQLFVEPGMNYYINPIKNNSFNQFQWGLNFGINVNF